MMRTSRTIDVAAVLIAAFIVVSCSDADDPVTPAAKKTVTISGAAGNGRVVSSDGKLDCRIVNGATSGPTCSAAFDSASVATLTASADVEHEFVAWSGDCTGVTCQLIVTRDVTVSPRFTTLRGTLSLSLTTPNADDGAIVFTVSGPTIIDLTPAAGLEVAETRVTELGKVTSTVLVRGNLSSGVIGHLTVRGLDVDSPYAIEVREAAARASGGYVQRTNLGAYRLQAQK